MNTTTFTDADSIVSSFEAQLKLRRKQSDDAFEESLDAIAAAVAGNLPISALPSSFAAPSAIDAILTYFRCKLPTTDLPPQLKSLEDQLDYRLRPYGILRRWVALEPNWRKDAICPMLAFWKEGGEAVALLPGKFSGYTYFDPATGLRKKVTAKVEALLDHNAVCFYTPLPQKSLHILDLLRFILQQMSLSDVLLTVGLLAATTLLGLLSPQFSSWLFGRVIPSGNPAMLRALAVFMVSYTISRACFTVCQAVVDARITLRQDILVQAAVMGRILSLPPKFFKGFSAGELTQRSMYVQQLCSIFSDTLFKTALSALMSLVYLGSVRAFAPGLTLPALFITLLTIAITLSSTALQTSITKQKMLLGTKTSGMTYSLITGVQKIKLAGAEKLMFARWAKSYAKAAKLEYTPPLFLVLTPTLSLAVNLLGNALLYACAMASHVSVANYYAFTTAYGMVSAAFMSLAGIAVTIGTILPTLDMAKPIMEATPEYSDSKEIVTDLHGSIELSHVSFQYGEDLPTVIDDLSLKIKAGEYVALVGSTGCGKSTLLRLLLGFEKPQRGAIYYDKMDLSRVDLQSLRRKIGVVMQDGKLFQGSVYSNIVVAAPQLTQDEAWEAARIASIAEDIEAMPMGMHTVIGEGQGGISGGQRQRLMIARAIAPKPKILMFDEATSALDNVTQRKVSEAIDSLHCTRIVIAHRLSTIQHCSRILYLDKGKVVEDGTYEELLAKNGYFADLVARQRLDTD